MVESAIAFVTKDGLELRAVATWDHVDLDIVRKNLIAQGKGPWTCARCHTVVEADTKIAVLIGDEFLVVAHVECPGKARMHNAG